MSKPSWKNAPPWANYLAMEADGTWFWYELEPWAEGMCFWNSHGKEEALASRSEDSSDTLDTLEKRQ